MKQKKFYFLIIGQIFALILIATLIFFDSSTIKSWFSKPTTYILQDPDCDLHVKPCTIQTSRGEVFTLTITPNSIPLMKPLTLSLKFSGIDIQSLEGKIFATNMDMGIHPITLKKSTSNSLEGVVTLPTCLVGNMKWRAEFLLPNSDLTSTQEAIVFTFQTDI